LPPAYVAIASDARAVLDAVDSLADEAELETVLAAITKVGDVYRALESLTEAPPGIDPAAFLGSFARKLFDYLLIDYLRDHLLGLASLFEALGIIGHEDVPAIPGQAAFTRSYFDWDKIPKRLSKPDEIPALVYGWGADNFVFPDVLQKLTQAFIAMNLRVDLNRMDDELGAAFQALASGPPASPIECSLKVNLFDVAIAGEYRRVAVRIHELPAEGSELPGLIVQPDIPNGMAETIDLGGGWSSSIRAGTDLGEAFGIVLRPNDIALRYPFGPGTALPSAGFGFSIGYESAEATALLGEPKKTRLEIRKASLSFELNSRAGDLEMKLGAAPEALALVVNPKDLDSFLGSALGDKDIRIEFPLAFAWSNRTGISFAGGLGFEVSAYPHLDFKLIRFDRIDLGLKFIAGDDEPPQLDLRVAAAMSGSIGPIAYAVDRLGVHLPITLEAGNAGPVDIGFDVLWPNGLGLVVDTGIVTGGGFIKLDPDKGRYFGVIQLKMFEIGVSAMAILDTKDASGNALPAPGFSFFLAISAEFSAIQLGYGFTLNGVGGLVGINRRMDKDAILAGVRKGALDGIMFPDDPVANANTILSNLTTIFPIAMNRYVFGPMALIGWGTPTLVRIELAMVLEVPAPILLALLGKASIAIPTRDEAIIAINLDVVGILDFGRSSLAVDARLRDSHITAFALSGEMAMRMNWGDKPNFALSVGGLNPHFQAPDGFPSLKRITVALGMGENPRVTLEGYFAVTSNSLQFGAMAELYASRSGFSVHGWLGFDALLIFQPLSFRIDFAAGMTLNRGSTRIAGVTVRGTLTGPSPFHAWGEGCVSFFFFDVCVPFDAVFGEDSQADLPDKDPWPLLEAAIKEQENWSAELGSLLTAVSLKAPPEGTAALLLHPMAAATLRQKVLPFNRPLERFGEYEIVGPDRYTIADVLGGDDDAGEDPRWTIVTDHFAPGDFETLSETEKLSRDSFEEMDAGVTFGGALVGLDTSAVKVASVVYETRIIDAGWKARRLPSFLLDRAFQLVACVRSAKAGSPLGKSGRGRFAPDSPRSPGVRLAPETYAVATVATLEAESQVAAATTRGAAFLSIKDKVGRGARAAQVQVVPTHELGQAA
jgi:hypothetical protein